MNWVSMSMKDLGREERGKKGAMSRQWREIGLLTKGTGPAGVRAPHADGKAVQSILFILYEAHSYKIGKYRQI